MKPKFKEKFKRWMKKRISFRLHMSFIILSTIFLGIVSNFMLLNTIEVTHPAARYPLTVLISYAWFLLFIRFYIKSILSTSSPSFNFLDAIDLSPNSLHSPSSTSTVKPTWAGGGGKFSGGGSSGSWESSEVVSDVAQDAISETAGNTISAVVDDEAGAIVVIIVGGALAAIVFGSGAYFIWHSPEILSECLLQVILVSGMRKRMKKFSEAEWFTHMFKCTIWPFVLVLFVSMIFGAFLRDGCPEASNLKDYRMRCWKG